MLPIGIAHAMTQDEHVSGWCITIEKLSHIPLQYDGYLVPKDAMIFFNICRFPLALIHIRLLIHVCIVQGLWAKIQMSTTDLSSSTLTDISCPSMV